MAVARDENIGSLDVPMYDEVAVCVLHCIAHLDEQFEALAHEQSAIVAIGVDGFPVDMFHH